MTYRIIFLLLCCVAMGCQTDPTPKPKGFLALSYSNPEYRTFASNCPYTFLYNTQAQIKKVESAEECMLNIVYPQMRGTIYITYEPVKSNLKQLLEDAQNLPLKHAIKADEIFGDKFENEAHKTYGMLYTVTGNAASQAQFYVTDSIAHFMTGSLYFKRKPNYDSIYPAAEYLKEDMRKLIESLQWK